MSDETKNEKVEGATDSKPVAKKKPSKKMTIVISVVAAVVVIGAGLWVWHGQPSFCNAVCHVPMDAYNQTFSEPANSKGVDKWGNDVENTSAMMSVVHASEGLNCLDCHKPVLSEQVGEGMNWVTGNYCFPLEERSTDQLMEASGGTGDQFCLNEACHNMTRADLIEATSDMKFNPHVAQHGERACSDCHKAHRASVMACTECHSDADVPEGWLTYKEANKLSQGA